VAARNLQRAPVAVDVVLVDDDFAGLDLDVDGLVRVLLAGMLGS